jgi:hypothetical protein
MRHELTKNEFIEWQLVNNSFNYSINTKGNEIAIYDKRLFNLSLHLDIEDWKQIRNKEYYQTCKNLQPIQQKKYLISCIENYFKQIEKRII